MTALSTLLAWMALQYNGNTSQKNRISNGSAENGPNKMANTLPESTSEVPNHSLSLANN
jgi:hypothetical protein